MPVIAISMASHLPVEGLVPRLAAKLGYAQAGPELLEEIARRYKSEVPKLEAALGAPRAWDRLNPNLRPRLLAYVRAGLLERLEADRVVSAGLAAHLFVQGVSHLFKVRLIADTEDRAMILAQAHGLTPAKALKRLADEDLSRQQWSLAAFGQDETAAGLYDLVINLSRVEPDQAAQIIADTVSSRKFQPMTFSLDILRDQALASRVRAELLELDPEVRVNAGKGRVWVRTLAVKRQQEKRVQALRALAQGVAGVAELEVQVLPDLIGQAADTMR
jgi:hypothetical protein